VFPNYCHSPGVLFAAFYKNSTMLYHDKARFKLDIKSYHLLNIKGVSIKDVLKLNFNQCGKNVLITYLSDIEICVWR